MTFKGLKAPTAGDLPQLHRLVDASRQSILSVATNADRIHRMRMTLELFDGRFSIFSKAISCYYFFPNCVFTANAFDCAFCRLGVITLQMDQSSKVVTH